MSFYWYLLAGDPHHLSFVADLMRSKISTRIMGYNFWWTLVRIDPQKS